MTMREKIARALAKLEYERDSGEPMPADFSGPDYQWEDWSHEADAVLDAIREPTEAMAGAGMHKLSELPNDTDWIGLARFGCGVWRAMADAAKDEGLPSAEDVRGILRDG